MVGKTSLLLRYIQDEFNPITSNRTLDAYFTEKLIKINENSFTLNIWVKNISKKYIFSRILQERRNIMP